MDVSAATARSSNDSERIDAVDTSHDAKDGLLPPFSRDDTSRTSTEENKFQSAISAWRSQHRNPPVITAG